MNIASNFEISQLLTFVCPYLLVVARFNDRVMKKKNKMFVNQTSSFSRHFEFVKEQITQGTHVARVGIPMSLKTRPTSMIHSNLFNFRSVTKVDRKPMFNERLLTRQQSAI